MASPASLSPTSQHDEIPLFRTSKKRKLHQRQRRQVSASPPPSTIQPSNPASLTTETLDEDHVNGQKTLAYKAITRKRLAGGIEFSGTSSSVRIQDEPAPRIESVPATAQEPLSLSTRFTPSTGVMNRKVDEERYLTAYIDSHLNDDASTSQTPPTTQPTTIQGTGATSASLTSVKQPAIVGRLQEIDLGPSARRKNEKATLKASRHLAPNTSHSISSSESDSDNPRKKKPLPPKIRVNRQGKILPPRRPRRGPQRSTEDVERDRVVEEMLRGDAPANHVILREVQGEDGTERDEELVERFRKEYAENSLAAASGKQSGSVKGSGAGVAVGPKMGGSRSLRAGNQGQGQGQRGRGK